MHRLNFIIILLLGSHFQSCTNGNQKNNNELAPPTFQNKGHELVYASVQKIGNYNKLASKNNVTYTYTYKTPDGKTDISTEKYIFDGEYSYGLYEKHERTFPQLEGVIEQGYDGKEFWLKHQGKILDDKALLEKVAFKRPTNYYWFTMFQKLLDPGLNYEYRGEKSINNKDYDIVKITFNSSGHEAKDIYQLYINKKTLLVDQFLFTIADYDIMDPKLMQLEYEEVDGILIPTKRQYKNSNWDAKVTDQPWIHVLWSDIKFNTEITPEDFQKNK